MLRALARRVDAWIDRGEGLGPDVDPFGPPLPDQKVAALREAVRNARFEPGPLRSPIALEGTRPTVDLLLRPPATGSTWCVLATPYGAFRSPARLGLYDAHARALRGRGLGVAALEPPFHGARAMQGRRSGWGFVSADLGRTMSATFAYAAEVAALARLLRDRHGAGRIVGLGLSLGGCALGLAAAHAAGFDRLAFLAAVDSPASFYATGANREARRRTLRAAGFGQVAVEEAFRPVAPSTYAAPAPALFAIPAQDQVVPARTQEAWRVAWSGELLELPRHGHGVALASRAVARRLAAWLAAAPA
ncbi:MAG TPA: hypothetical protein VFH47_05060 [Candidatus Thermoplasmatota archaeon]|nr:hypothetical protein [Candidatus Thermoplasmatota archaeon]